jgi:hypothetical protein
MNKTRLVTIVCSCISALALIGLVIWFLVAQPWGGGGFGGFGWFGGRGNIGGFNIETLTGPLQAAGSQSVASTGINSFEIDWVAGEVTIIPHDGTDIIITEFAQRDLADNERFGVNVPGDGSVVISFVENRRTFRRMPSKSLEVLVPQSIAQDLVRLSVDTTSARINISDISALDFSTSSVSGAHEISNANAPTFSAGSTSGRMEISNVAAQSLRASSVSGRITLNDVTSDGVNVGSTSGTLELRNVNAGLLDTRTVSGSQDFSGAFVRLDANSTSGRVSVLSTIVPESLDISSVSGRVSITVPDDGNTLSVSHSSVSGRFSSELPVLMHTADARFRISTTSGNISI